MNSLLRITKEMIIRYAHVFLVLLAFAMMVASSYLFVGEMENRHLKRSAGNAILYTEAAIKSDMLELETLLGVASETINVMLTRGDSSDAVNEYILLINHYVENSEKRLYGATGIFGVFDVFGGQMLIGYESWTPPDDYYQTDRPWYTGAVEAAGEISTTEPYLNVYSNEITITLSRRIFDKNGNALGIICLNIELDRIAQYVVTTQFAEDGYGFLLSKNIMIIAHPDPDMVGLSFRDVRSGIGALIDEFAQRGSLSEVVTTDYRGITSIVFVQQLKNGWYMGVVTPRDSYFQSTRNLAITLTAFGVIFAALLIWMLLRISAEKALADERMKKMIEDVQQRSRLLDTVNSAAAILLSKSAVEAFETSLLKSFELVGLCLDVDRVQIWRNEEIGGSMHFVLRYEWLSDYGRTCSQIPHGLHFSYSIKQDWQDKFLRGENINAPLSELPEEDRLFLGSYGIKSIVILPMFLNGDFWGFFSIDDCRSERALANEEIGILISAGLMMTNAVNRNIQASIIRETNERIQSIFEAAPLAITMWDPNTFKLLDCNMEAMRLVGLTDKNAYIEKFAEMSPEYQPNGQKTSDMVPEIFDKTMRDGIIRYNWNQMSVDGEVIPFSVNTVRIKHMDGYIVISYAQDMREINAAIEKMRRTDEFTRVIFNAMPLACQLWDKDLNCIMCNDEAVRLYRAKDKGDFLNNFFSFSPEYQPDGRLSKEKGYENLMKAFNDGYCRFDWLHIKGDGEEFRGEITIIPAMYGGEPALIGYTRDLSDEMTAIRERQKAEIAEESNRAKSNFLARVSHEIRTPMNAILGIAEIQLQDESHRPETKEALERIYNSGDLLLGIINDILDLSKIEAGKLALTHDQYDIPSLIHDTVQINILRYETKPIEFVLDVSENLPILLIGDQLRIKQILNNLLSNAFKYTERGAVKMTVYDEPVTTEPQDSSKRVLVFIINDTGQGMTAEQVQKLGSEYSRFNLEANRKTEGTGLGMNITRNLIHLMNGSLSVESTPGKGSTFTVRLPQESPGSAVIGKGLADNLMRFNLDKSVKSRASHIRKEYMPYGRVLVVDDVETNLYVAKGLMASYGLAIETAISGFEAIDKIRNGSVYDVIFMDHMMPKMDGIEAAKIIRSLGYSKPIVALTANALAGQAAMFLENGFDDFISKPIDIRQLNMTLNKLVRDKYPAEVVEEARKQKTRLYSDGGQNKSLSPELAEIFVRDAKKAIKELEAVYLNKCGTDDDLSTFVITIHAMKSALANVGETDLSAEAAKLEQAGREKNTGLVLSELPSFLETLNAAAEKLEPVEFKEDTGENADNSGDSQYLKEKLLIVKEACASLDKKTAKDTLAEIREKTWPKSVNEQLSAMSAHLLHSEFDEVIQIIDG